MRMEEIVEETNGNREKMVEITLKMIGPARPSSIHVPSSIRVRFHGFFFVSCFRFDLINPWYVYVLFVYYKIV